MPSLGSIKWMPAGDGRGRPSRRYQPLHSSKVNHYAYWLVVAGGLEVAEGTFSRCPSITSSGRPCLNQHHLWLVPWISSELSRLVVDQVHSYAWCATLLC